MVSVAGVVPSTLTSRFHSSLGVYGSRVKCGDFEKKINILEYSFFVDSKAISSNHARLYK